MRHATQTMLPQIRLEIPRHVERSIPPHIPFNSSASNPCLNVRCGHKASWHYESTLGRRGRCHEPGGCWCRKYQAAEPVEGAWMENLDRLRARGRWRARTGTPSPSLMPLLNDLPDNAIIIDVGCGDSGDRLIAEQLGLVAYSIDLFPPTYPQRGFVQADALSLPFQSHSIDGIVFHAVVSLIKPINRRTVYHEMARVLKPNGILSLALYWFSDGYSVIRSEEDARIVQAGFWRKRSGSLYRRRA